MFISSYLACTDYLETNCQNSIIGKQVVQAVVEQVVRDVVNKGVDEVVENAVQEVSGTDVLDTVCNDVESVVCHTVQAVVEQVVRDVDKDVDEVVENVVQEVSETSVLDTVCNEVQSAVCQLLSANSQAIVEDIDEVITRKEVEPRSTLHVQYQTGRRHVYAGEKCDLFEMEKHTTNDLVDYERLSYGEFRKTYYKTKKLGGYKKPHSKQKAVIPADKKPVLKQENITHTSTYSVNCCICKRKFSTKVMLNKHRQICQKKRLEKVQPAIIAPRLEYSCTKCTDKFSSENTLELHLKYDHRPRPTCMICSKMFDCRRQLINHEENCAGMQSGEKITKQSLGIIDVISSSDVFVCGKCENPFYCNDVLRQHKILLNKRNPLEIILSDESQKENVPLNENLEICIKNSPVFETVPVFQFGENNCKDCGKCFQNNRRLVQHNTFSHHKNTQICEDCGKSFRNNFRLDQHMAFCKERLKNMPPTSTPVKEKTTESSTTFVCKWCSKSFSLLNNFNIHLRKVHGYRYCNKCEETYKYYETSWSNVHRCVPPLDHDTVMSSDDACVNCGKTDKWLKFRTKVAHVCFESNTCVDVKEKCIDASTYVPRMPHCKRKMRHPDGLRSLKKKKSLKNKCSKCSQHFPSVGSYEQHLERNINKDLFHCMLCFCRSYQHFAHLNEHMRRAHGKSQCRKCKQIFEKKPRDHTCAIKYALTHCYRCGVECKNLLYHLISHSSLRPFDCEECGERFKTPTHLNEHMKKIHDSYINFKNPKKLIQMRHKIETCRTCNSYVIAGADMIKHMRTAHYTGPVKPAKEVDRTCKNVNEQLHVVIKNYVLRVTFRNNLRIESVIRVNTVGNVSCEKLR